MHCRQRLAVACLRLRLVHSTVYPAAPSPLLTASSLNGWRNPHLRARIRPASDAVRVSSPLTGRRQTPLLPLPRRYTSAPHYPLRLCPVNAPMQCARLTFVRQRWLHREPLLPLDELTKSVRRGQPTTCEVTRQPRSHFLSFWIYTTEAAAYSPRTGLVILPLSRRRVVSSSVWLLLLSKADGLIG